MKVNLYYNNLVFFDVKLEKALRNIKFFVWKEKEIIFAIDTNKNRLKFKSDKGIGGNKEYDIFDIGGAI